MNIRAVASYPFGQPTCTAPDLARLPPKTRKIGIINVAKPQYIVSDALMDTI
jgi:hypothetical protein